MASIGVPKEIKIKENRVALIPSNVKVLIENHHEVHVQTKAGLGAGYTDKDYQEVGAHIEPTAKGVYKKADIIVKVKEPQPSEYKYLSSSKILFTYLHLTASEETKKLTKALLENDVTGIAYETIEDEKGQLPLLKPMSTVAGQLAIDYGARFLQTFEKGRGKLIGRVEGTAPTDVVVLGGGNVGFHAAMKAAGTGANVSILDVNPKKIDSLKKEFEKINSIYQNVEVVLSNEGILKEYVKKADLLVGAILVPGGKSPKIVTEEMIKGMKDGAVIVDVAIDQGGCTELSKPTTHEKPAYIKHGKIFCCITNMPGAVARTSTQALTNATFPYLLKIANEGIEVIKKDKGFAKGVNTYKGYITYRQVAEDLNMNDKYKSLEELI